MICGDTKEGDMRLLVRIRSSHRYPMVVEANVDHEFLERTHKLVRICEKIRKTMNGPARVIIENSRGEYVSLESPAVVQWVLNRAGVKEWSAIQYLIAPEDLLLGRIGRCLVQAGMRSRTLISAEGLWFEGSDEKDQYVSVVVDREGLSKLLEKQVSARDLILL
jgi:hypothetical protein